jgi:quinol monooxygenase YgiN
MLTTQILKLLWILAVAFIPAPCRAVTTESMEELVRVAELDIDPDQLDAYRTALKEEISTSIAVEPGVLTLYAVAVKDHRNQIRILERYADQRFKKYKSQTQSIVRSLKLIETSPILLGAKVGQQ